MVGVFVAPCLTFTFWARGVIPVYALAAVVALGLVGSLVKWRVWRIKLCVS